MLRNRKVLKTIAVFFLINFLTVVFSDTIVAFAESKSVKEISQAKGGTIPSSVNDGSVDLKTGDYSYTLPIMEVPGPEGNYPINLIYNAGVQLNQSSSMVGLGWTLDAGGSISRTLNGFPDDFCGAKYTVTDTIKTSYNYTNPFAYSSQLNMAQQLSSDIMNVNFFDNTNIPFSLTNGQYAPWSYNTYTQLGSVVPPGKAWDSTSIWAYGCLNGYAAQQRYNVGLPYEENHLPTTTFDCKNLYNPNSWNVTDAPENTTGGCILQPDNYYVSGSGISGAIEPLILDNGSLFRNDYFNAGNNQVSFTLPLTSTLPIPFSNPNNRNGYNYGFRFKNDFSNSFTVNPASPTLSSYPSNPGYYGWTFPASPGYTYQAPANYLTTDDSNNPAVLSGSTSISYSTHSQGLYTPNYQGYTNSKSYTDPTNSSIKYNIANQIRGFSVTNPQGISYSYALPVFTYKSQKYVHATSAFASKSSRTLEIDQPYAYTWLLTTITGPDFLDMNGNGFADEGDQGSWTNFNYGKYSSNYLTRTPYTGMKKEADGASSYAGAYMEVYYLDAISTRTHTALFQKATRNDNMGAYNLPRGGYSSGVGGTLQLQNVLLYSNQKLMSLTSTSSIYNAITSLKSANIPGVFDNSDLATLDPNYAGLNGTTSNNIQYVNLASDNSLCQGTPDNPSTVTGQQGKLTLKTVSFYGANGSYGTSGAQLKPPVNFIYELPNKVSDVITGIIEGNNKPFIWTITTQNTSSFNPGDIITFTYNGNTYYAAIVSLKSSSWYIINFLGTSNSANLSQIFQNAGGGLSLNVSTTKNPPYTYNFYDNWGYFKSDYSGITGNENVDREVTPASSAGVDAWSLRTIQTSLGATVNISYQSDDFIEAEYVQDRIYNICDSMSTFGHSVKNTFNMTQIGGDVQSPITSTPFQFTVRETMNPNDVPAVNSLILIETMAGVSGTASAGSGYFTVTGVSTNSYGKTVINGNFNATSVGSPQYNPFAVYAGMNNYTLKHYGSYMVIPRSHNYGGGLRTTSISVQESVGGDLFQTNYDYNTYVNNSITPTVATSSGVVSYEPAIHTALYPFNNTVNFPSNSPETTYWQAYNQFYSDYMGFYNKAFFYSDFIVPEVIYSTVHKKEVGNSVQAPTYDEYIYQTYDDTLFQRKVIGVPQMGNDYYTCTTPAPAQDSATTVKLKDYTSCVGNLLSHRTYDLSNNLLSKEDYIYANAENHPSRQGVLEQVSNINIYIIRGEYFVYQICPPNPKFHLYSNALTTVKGQYPHYLKKVIKNDYLKGTSVTTENKSFDQLSGQPIDVQTTDTYGNVKVSTTVPAYHVYNTIMYWYENMITQLCASYTYNTTTNTGVTLSSPTSTAINNEVTQYNYSLTLSGTLPTGDALDTMINVNETMYPISSLTTNTGNNTTTVGFSTYTQLPSSGNYIRVKSEVLSANIQTWTNGFAYFRDYANGYYQTDSINDQSTSTTNYQYYVFRPYRNYIWTAPYLNQDGSYNNTGIPGSYTEFNWNAELTNTPQSRYWQKVKENTLYDFYSNLLESKDINGNYVSVKMDAIQDNKVSTVTNSNYCSSLFWGFEDTQPQIETGMELGWGLVQSPAIPGAVIPHTGSYMASITPSQTWGPTYVMQNLSTRNKGNIITGKAYQASVWVHQSSDPKTTLVISYGGSASGVSDSASVRMSKSASTIKVGNWYLLTVTLPIPVGYVSQNAPTGIANDVRVYVANFGTVTSYIDDLMFHPVDADLTGYVYDPNTNLLLYQLDGNGFFTQYQYDPSYRLTATFKETLKGVKQVSAYQYVYK